MSWSAASAGDGKAVAQAIGQQLDYAVAYPGSEPQYDVVNALRSTVQAFAARFPDQSIVVETGGHVDGTNGQVTLSMRTFPKPVAG